MDRIKNNAGPQFKPQKYKEGLSICGVRLELAAPEHQEMNGQIEVTW